jgi:DNA-binding transcriptional MerR regulator
MDNRDLQLLAILNLCREMEMSTKEVAHIAQLLDNPSEDLRCRLKKERRILLESGKHWPRVNKAGTDWKNRRWTECGSDCFPCEWKKPYVSADRALWRRVVKELYRIGGHRLVAGHRQTAVLHSPGEWPGRYGKRTRRIPGSDEQWEK